MPTARLLLFALAALALGACSQTTSTRSHWVTTDGKPADPAARSAAGARCREKVQVVSRAGPGESQEWALAMLDCLRGEGFVLVTDDDPDLGR